jgi:adenylate cyclase
LALLTYFFFLIGLLAKAFRLLYIQPVQVFQKGVERISAGNYDWRLPITATDELGELSADFNRMAAGLQEKDFMARFVSDLAMEAVKKTGKSPAVRVVGSVLFADIRGFTTLSESFSPEEVVDMLNNYLTRMEEVIENNDGVIDKFIGDAIMAVFLPIHGKALPAERAVRAGIAMIMATREFSRERETAGAFAVRNGVGIATGRLLMGVLGKSAGRQDFTVTGLTVNLAAQMEKYSKLARQLPVVICQQTAAELAGMVAIEPLAGTPADIAAFEVVP